MRRTASRWGPGTAALALATVVATTLLVAAVGCGGNGDDQNNQQDSYHAYWVATVDYDPASEKVTVIGLYEPNGSLESCLLPESQVKHVFRLGDDGWVTFEGATPIEGSDLREWAAAVRSATSDGDIEIPGRGKLSIWSWPDGYATGSALVIPCTTAAFQPDDATPVAYMELRCGYCVEHGCGNDICDPGEDWDNCRYDCPPPVTVCGDGTCDYGETESCRLDCGCTNAECLEHCTTSPSPGDYGYCNDVEGYPPYGTSCTCGFFNTPCDGSEPFCNPDDQLGDEVYYCDTAVSARLLAGCNQLCWEAYGTSGGTCDATGTGDCVCEGGLSPW